MPDDTLLKPISMTAHPEGVVRYLAFGTQMRATLLDMLPRAHVSVLPVLGVTVVYVPTMTMPAMMRQAGKDMLAYMSQLADQMEEEMAGKTIVIEGQEAG